MIVSELSRKMYLEVRQFSQALRTRCCVLLTKGQCGMKHSLGLSSLEGHPGRSPAELAGLPLHGSLATWSPLTRHLCHSSTDAVLPSRLPKSSTAHGVLPVTAWGLEARTHMDSCCLLGVSPCRPEVLFGDPAPTHTYFN